MAGHDKLWPVPGTQLQDKEGAFQQVFVFQWIELWSDGTIPAVFVRTGRIGPIGRMPGTNATVFRRDEWRLAWFSGIVGF